MADDLSFEGMVQMLVVTAAVVGAPTLTPAVARAMMQRLEKYPAVDVVRALQRCQEEIHDRRFALADVLERVKELDGRPGADAAWAIAARGFDESDSFCWTSEMAIAFGTVRHMEDRVAARMAFKEHYSALCDQARQERESVRWEMSDGHDTRRRGPALREAVALGRLPASAFDILGDASMRLLPDPASDNAEYVPIPAELRAEIARIGKRVPSGEEP